MPKIINVSDSWQKRVLEGDFVQYRELFAPGKRSPWKFQITGFDSTVSGQDGYCNVLKSDNTKQRVRIDKKDRILINGRWYGRDHWAH